METYIGEENENLHRSVMKTYTSLIILSAQDIFKMKGRKNIMNKV